jgi:hypothetical protein
MIFGRDHQPLIDALTCRYRVHMVVAATVDNRYWVLITGSGATATVLTSWHHFC